MAAKKKKCEWPGCNKEAEYAAEVTVCDESMTMEVQLCDEHWNYDYTCPIEKQ